MVKKLDAIKIYGIAESGNTDLETGKGRWVYPWGSYASWSPGLPSRTESFLRKLLFYRDGIWWERISVGFINIDYESTVNVSASHTDQKLT